MSASLDKLEDLDNKALRKKCVEFGLPNIPITDTSKKLLIKRLRAAMAESGMPAGKEKPRSRSEIVHVIKVETEKTKVKEAQTPTKIFSGRRTIGPTISIKDKGHARTTVTRRRRSGRTTPVSQVDNVVPRSTKRKLDDEVAPSLSKNLMVATSNVKGTPKEIIELGETETEEDEEEPELISEIEPSKYTSFSRTYDSYDISKPFTPYLEKEPILNCSSGRIIQPVSGISLSRAPISTLSLQSSAARRYTTGGYKTPAEANENGTFMHHTDNVLNKKESEAPYLSDFVRKLSRLKPEPLKSAFAPLIKNEALNRQVPRYYSTPVISRPGISQ